MAHNSTGSNHRIVADGDAAKDNRSRVDADIVANGRPATAAIAQCHQLEAIEVAADSFGIQVSGIIVFEMGSRANFRAPDVEGPLRW